MLRSFRLASRSSVSARAFASQRAGRGRKAAAAKSTVDASGSDVKVPLALHDVAGRYATALYSAAVKQGTLDKVEKEFADIMDMANKDASFASFLKDPTLAREKKRAVMDQVLTKNKASDTARSFFELVADNGRLHQADRIASSFARLMAAHRGEMNATVTTAVEVDKKMMDRIRKSLLKLNPNATKMAVETKVDPSILGGVVVEMGDKFVDLSIRSRIEELRTQLDKPVQ